VEHLEPSAVLSTARLLLRRLRPEDAPAIADGIADWQVMRWLTTPPWPYALADAEWFIGDAASTGAHAILANGSFAGVVHISPEGELGYWLARPFHGLGYMTEAAGALVGKHFALGGGPLWSGYVTGNAASCNVLTKIGFTNTEVVRKPARPLNRDVDIQRMALTAEAWAARNPLRIETARLVLRPHSDADAAVLSRIGGMPEVARMMSSVNALWPEADVLDWMAKSRWRGAPGFRMAICLRDGTVIGSLGLGGAPLSTAYFLGRDHWGQGFATEAMRAFLAEAFTHFDLTQLEAGAFVDNPASHAVLRKLGFLPVGSEPGTSLARLEPASITLYRLSLASFKAAHS